MGVVPVVEEPEEMRVGPDVEQRAEQPQPAGDDGVSGARLAVVVAFLNEGDYLPRFLSSIHAQTRHPDLLVLVDDGSDDGSYELAQAFAEEHRYALAVRRPRRPAERDRLATAAELKAFDWGRTQINIEYDVVAKLDADLVLRPSHFAEILSLFERDAGIGIAGAYLSTQLADGTLAREEHPTDHVRGPNKFYRRECFDQIWPVAAHLGWDTVDEVKARMHGWRTSSVALSQGDSVHLRPTGMHDGRTRAYRRWGECAYGYGSHPLHVLAAGLARARRRPYVVCGVAYIAGWANAALHHKPQVEHEVRAFRRREELARLRAVARRRLGRKSS